VVILSRNEGVVQREVAGEVFLVPIRGHLADLQELFVLNETGLWVWQRLEGGRAVDDLATEMAAEFAVDEASAQADIRGFAAGLVEAGLARLAEERA
jgi:hypothetical protein